MVGCVWLCVGVCGCLGVVVCFVVCGGGFGVGVVDFDGVVDRAMVGCGLLCRVALGCDVVWRAL